MTEKKLSQFEKLQLLGRRKAAASEPNVRSGDSPRIEEKERSGDSPRIDTASSGDSPRIKGYSAPFRSLDARDAHTVWEQRIYQHLWKLGASATPDDYRDLAIGYRHLAAELGMGVNTVQRGVPALIEKLSIEVIGDYDPNTRSPKTYRVYSYRMILDRRRAAGREMVQRRGGHGGHGVELLQSDDPGTVPRSREKADLGTVVDLGTVPGTGTGDYPWTRDSTSLGRRVEKDNRTSSSSLARVVVEAVNRFGLTCDDDAAERLLAKCLASDPAASADEIAHFIAVKLEQFRRKRNIENPVGLLLRSVPQYFKPPRTELTKLREVWASVALREPGS